MKTIYTLIFTVILFSQSVFAQCTGTTTLNAASGSFSDGSGPGAEYVENLNCYWLISPAGAGTISLTFTALDLELYQCSDKVRIYDGSDTLSNLIGTACGTTIPGTITSTGGTMLIRFTSDVSYNGDGWDASYTSTTAPPVYCSGNTTFTTASGSFTDGSNSANYSNNSSCTWSIQPPAATTITLTFSALNVENGQDFIRVYDNSTSPPLQMAVFSGSTIPSPIVLTGGDMLVEFTSNSSGTDLGFAASYTSTVAPPVFCSGSTTLTAVSGSFNDGSGTDNYSDGADCTWLIQPINTTSITLTFNDFSTQGGMDFVKVYDNSTSPATQIGSYSGNSIPAQLTLPASAMKVHFTSNGSVTDLGWSASYTSLNVTGIADKDLNKANITIFPNPFHQTATLKFSVPEADASELIVYDVLGKSLIKMAIPPFTPSVVIDAKSLPNGMYFYSLSKNDLLIHTGKLIIE